MSLAPTSTVPLPAPETTAPRRRWTGAVVAFVVGLAVPAGVVVADRTGEPLSVPAAEEETTSSPAPFLEGDRLERALATLVAEAGSSQAAQLAFDGRDVSADLVDPLTGQYVRVDQYELDAVDEAYESGLTVQPPREAAFDLATIPPATLLAAMATANRALGNEDEDLQYLEVLVERPFPGFGDPVIVVSDSFGVPPHRVWLSTDGTVLRVDGR